VSLTPNVLNTIGSRFDIPSAAQRYPGGFDAAALRQSCPQIRQTCRVMGLSVEHWRTKCQSLPAAAHAWRHSTHYPAMLLPKSKVCVLSSS